MILKRHIPQYIIFPCISIFISLIPNKLMAEGMPKGEAIITISQTFMQD